MLTDLRLAARRLLRAPGYAAAAALTLALGLAAATAVFALADAVALRPFRYPAAERLVALGHAVPGVGPGAEWGISKANYFAYGRLPVFDGVAIYQGARPTLTGGSAAGGPQAPAEQVHTVMASPDLFALLGARPQLGRLFGAGDVPREGDAPRVVVLGDALWRARFGADPRVVGRTVRVDGTAMTVAGVLAPLQALPTLAGADGAGPGLWMPMPLDAAAPAQNSHTRRGLARLRPGASPADAEVALRAEVARFVERFPEAYTPAFMARSGFAPRVTPLRDAVVGPLRRPLWVVLGGSGLLLAVACANVAALAAARREARLRDAAVRAALGAGRARLAREALAETAVLAGAAATLALPAAAAALRVARALAPRDDVPLVLTARVDPRAAAACLAAALVAMLFVGVAPVLRARPAFAALRDGGRGATPDRRRAMVRRGLVAGQVAVALVLLTGAGLLAESVRRLRAVAPGFDARGVLLAVVTLPSAKYDTEQKAAAFWQALEARLEATPGVAAAGGSTWPPMAGGGCSGVRGEGAAPGQENPCVGAALATPGYFRALGIRVDGAWADWTQVRNGRAGVLVSDALASRLWPGRGPLGRGLRGGRTDSSGAWYRVAGVTRGVRADGLDAPVTEIAYFPVVAPPGVAGQGPAGGMAVLVRAASGDPERLVPAVRRALRELDPDVPLGITRSLDDVVVQSRARLTFTTALLGAGSALAVALAAVGLYGTLAYVVGLRRREMGVRMALGARAAQVRALVLGESARLAAVGLALGLAGAVAATRLLRSLLFGVAPGDLRVLTAVAAALAAVAVAASWGPARRATRVDPSEALRAD